MDWGINVHEETRDRLVRFIQNLDPLQQEQLAGCSVVTTTCRAIGTVPSLKPNAIGEWFANTAASGLPGRTCQNSVRIASLRTSCPANQLFGCAAPPRLGSLPVVATCRFNLLTASVSLQAGCHRGTVTLLANLVLP